MANLVEMDIGSGGKFSSFIDKLAIKLMKTFTSAAAVENMCFRQPIKSQSVGRKSAAHSDTTADDSATYFTTTAVGRRVAFPTY